MNTTMKTSKSARNAIAYVHLTGRMPKYIRHETFMSVYYHTDSVPFDINNIGGPTKSVKSEHVAEIEAHPQVVKVRELQADGWRIEPDLGRMRVRSGVTLYKLGKDRKAETTVYPDGKQGRVWGEENLGG